MKPSSLGNHGEGFLFLKNKLSLASFLINNHPIYLNNQFSYETRI